MGLQKEISDSKLIIADPSYTNENLHTGDASGIGNFGTEAIVIRPDGCPKFIHDFFIGVGLDVPLALKVVLAKKLPEEIILAHNEGTGLVLAALKRVGLFKNKLMIWSHGALSEGPFGFKAALTRFGLYDRMITLSEEEREGFRKKYKVSSEKVVCNPAPVNIDQYVSQGKPKSAKPTVFTSGVSDRDNRTVIEAAKILPDVTFIIDPTSPSVPPGDLSWIENVPENLQIKLNLSHEEYIKEVEDSWFGILAIKKGVTQLSAGCTLVTSFGSMRKTIVAATEGLREYILDEETGFLVKPECPEKLAEKIRYLIDNPEKCRLMGLNARKFMEDNFSSEACVRRFKAMAAELRKTA